MPDAKRRNEYQMPMIDVLIPWEKRGASGGTVRSRLIISSATP